jgi:tetratricopeptide (TPR) repeat protein
LRYPLRATVSDRIAAPALTGLVPARLIIPSAFGEARFNVRQLRQILLHELAHVQQGHLFLHWLALIARALHWFNPAIHFAAIRLRQECELAADAAALKRCNAEERAIYGETILEVLAQSQGPRTALVLGMAEEARHLQQRLRALTANRRAFGPLGLVFVVLIGWAGLTGRSLENKDSSLRGADREAVHKDASPNATAINDARFLIEVGRLDAAEKILKQALSVNPNDRAAKDLLELVIDQRAQQEKRKEGLSTTNQFRTNAPDMSPARQAIHRKLQTIRIDDFPLPSEVDLVEVLKELGSEVRKRDPNGRGINLIISQSADRDPNAPAPIDVERFRIKFDPPLRDVTLGQFFDAMVRVALPPEGAPPNVRLKYSIEDYAIIFSQDVGAANAPGTSGRTPNGNSVAGQNAGLAQSAVARQKLIQKLDTIRIDDLPLTTPVDLIEVLKELRMETRKLDPEHEGVNFVIDKSERMKGNEEIDLERFQIKIDPPVRNVTLGQLCDVMVRVAAPPEGAPRDTALTFAITDYGVVFSLREEGDRARPGAAVQQTEPPANAPKPGTARANRREDIFRKLQTVRIDEFAIKAETDLLDVLKELGSQIRNPDGSGGINFITSRSTEMTTPTTKAAIDPLTGLPLASGQTEIDAGEFKITVNPPLRDVRLGQLLDAFVSVAKAPQGVAGFQLAYSVEDYGIVFRPRRVEQQFVSRTFRVNPNLFKQGLEGVSFSGNPFQGNVNGQPNGAVTPPGNSGISYVTTVTNINTIQQRARAFFIAAGVDFPTNNVAVGGAVPNNFGRPEPGQPTQKAFFLNDRTGVLYVRATVDELNMIENSLHTLNAGSAQPNGSGPPEE